MSQFSSYRMGPGRAFRLGAQAEAESTYTPVVKRWETIEGRTVLFEQIEWSACEAMLAALPRRAQAESGTECAGALYASSTSFNAGASDTDGDGLPDYAEDHNGNNLVNGGETSPDDPGSDYDGRSDSQELAEGTDPVDSDSATETQLGWWRFNSTGWPGEAGQVPGSLLVKPSAGRARFLPSRDGSSLATVFDGSAGASPYRERRFQIRLKAFANVQAVASWSGTAVQVYSASPANLK
ncbi:MAG: hypothetical protein FJ387_00160 [Verrucomicrobia bacterium]|nr:hypothetical protein [Verrucomicrobiota bacterium]